MARTGSRNTVSIDAGVIGLPANTKEAGKRVDFRPNDFDLQIEAKGYRVAWIRAAQCPCVSVHDQTDHPNPNCPICEGSGVLYFPPDLPNNSTEIGDLTRVQELIVAQAGGTIIRGIITGIGRELDQWDRAGRIYQGRAQVTVNSANILGYYDKLVFLDARVVYSQLAKVPETGNLKLRYPIVQLNLLRSEAGVLVEGTDYRVLDGEICFFDGNRPATDTKLAAHYYCHPTYLVTEHPHSIRQSLVKQKNPNPKTPRGDVVNLPIQAAVQLEFVPE